MNERQKESAPIGPTTSRWGLALMKRFAATTSPGRYLLHPVVAPLDAPAVAISPGTQVTPQDVAQFNSLWMNTDATLWRRGFYEGAMKNRQAWIAWAWLAQTTVSAPSGRVK